MTEQLKPCPFCGGAANLLGRYDWSKDEDRCFAKHYYIKCTQCPNYRIKLFKTKQEAIEAWNRRTDDE